MKQIYLAIPLLAPAVALAHAGHADNWFAGFLHPLSGLDHLLAAIGLGIWLGQGDARPRAGFIAGFALMLLLGIALGAQFPGARFESGVVVTLVVIGGLSACGLRGPLPLRALTVATIAAVHGFVHGTELSDGFAGLAFALALTLSSAAVTSTAAAVGLRMQTGKGGVPARAAGAVILLTGIALGLTR